MKRRPISGLPLLILLASACDLVPTAAPKWDMTWNVPGKGTSIAVSSFLPSGVTTATTGNGTQIFSANVSAVSVTRLLSTDCPACALAQGLSVPKPAFTAQGSSGASLPAGISSATLVNDTLTITITNNFNFDPIKPTAVAAGDTGWVVTTVTSGATVIGKDSINGQTTALGKNGATATRRIPLAGTVNSTNGITVAVSIRSPVGDNVLMDATKTIVISASAGQLGISTATVSLANQNVTSSPDTVDLSGIDNSVSGRVNGGMFLLSVANPFAASGNLSVTFLPVGGTAIKKTIVLATGGPAAPATADTVSFTSTEIKAILGHTVTVTFSGAVTGSSVAVTPGSTVAVTSRLQLNLETSESQ